MSRYEIGKLFPSITENTESAMRLLAISPFEKPDVALCRKWVKQGAVAAVDLGRDSSKWSDVFAKISQDNSGLLGVRVPDAVNISAKELPLNTAFVVLTAERDLAEWKAFPVIVQVTSKDEAARALEAGASGLIAKGRESGGVVGNETAYILLQRLLEDEKFSSIPLWSQGGIGLHTAPAVIAGGAFGVVLDSQLSLLSDRKVSQEEKQKLQKLEGTESRVIHDYAVYIAPGKAEESLEDLSAEDFLAQLNQEKILPLGQDAALANDIYQQCSTCEGLVNQLRVSIAGHIRQAKALESLAADSPLARQHGTRYPIAQGPMTRVSDTAEFAKAVADNGALPFLALSLMNEKSSDKLLQETQSLLGDKSWGVGILGFASADVLKPQLELLKQYKPKVVLIAGGRPSQARALEELGMQAYLHVPAPSLIDLFLKDGARSFVFEGHECGGHIGPRSSFVLWEQQINRLLKFDHPEQLNLLFAGGIHDERSASMVATLAAPLAARGAKVGVLMGSAYIATKEAVQARAVNEIFQEKIIEGDITALLETAPGHAIRGLDTEFVTFFHEEKAKLKQQGLDKKEIWEKLEELNLGRLRLATKGFEREGGELVERDRDAQLASGMYMIGQLVAMRNDICDMADLHESVSPGANAFLQNIDAPEFAKTHQHEPIAIVGMDCIYPGSPDLETYWANILEGKDLVTEVPAERWNADLYYNEKMGVNGKTPSKWGGFIDDFAFNPLDYGIPPQSMAAIEPVQLLSLEVSRRALVDAGYAHDLSDLDKEKASVIFGAESGTDLAGAYSFRNNYPQYLGELPPELDDVLPNLTEDSFPGVLVNVIAGRVANRLDLGGVNYTVDSACASSLTAVEVAVKELRAGTSDIVLAGGADFHNAVNDFLMFASVTALSASGRCRSFDNNADGIALGEGVGVVVMKRLSDAQRDGDRIYAVIDGIAGSSDGKSLGLTAPRKEGQKRALDRAYSQAGVLAGDIGLVEAHGTGTVVGDKTELATLTEIYNQGGALPQQTVLGSVKSQIGHTKCAAGIAGLIKITKALYHRILPPTQNIQTPNAYYQPTNSPFSLDKHARPWLDVCPRAAISAFGFGGTNFHAVLSAPDDIVKRGESGVAKWPAEIFVFTGSDFSQAAQQMETLATFISTDARHELRDLSFSLWQLSQTEKDAAATKAAEPKVQCVIVANDVDELKTLLVKALAKQQENAIFYRSQDKVDAQGNLAFLFPGQGSQSPGMLRDIFLAFPSLRPVLLNGAEWMAKLFPPTAYDEAGQKAQKLNITDTRVAQPTLGMADFAMASVLQSLGVKPEMLAGHSYGELVALAVAGSFDIENLLQLSAARGRSILAAADGDPGTMAAVSADKQSIEDALQDVEGVVLANQNSPTQTVISGATPAVEQAINVLKEKGIAAKPINVACAFHSPVVANAEQIFAEHLAQADVKAPQLSVYSNQTADIYAADAAVVKQKLASHIVNPVRWVDQVEAMYDNGARTFIEVGPGRVLSGLVKSILKDKSHTLISTDDKSKSGMQSLLEAVAQLLVLDQSLNLDVLFSGRQAKTLDLTQPVHLAKTVWWVNGARAKPLNGQLPKHAAKEILAPVAVASQVASAAPLTQADATVAQYLHNMRDMVYAQRDVMLGMFGQPAAAAPQVYNQANQALPVAAAVTQTGAASEAAVLSASAEKAAPVKDVQQSLIGIVSERTGYPAEMLELDLDLEADLSIDSIKRVEIIAELADDLGFKNSLGADADTLMEELATQKSLRGILSWLKQQLPEDAVGASGQAPAVETPAESGSAPVNVQALLLNIVSDRTGYPEDVLELDLDLEADLSIDSIKRLEIVGDLSGKLGLDKLVVDKDSALESLAALKTLRAMVDWLSSNTQQDTVPASAAVPASEASIQTTPADSLSSEIAKIALSRYVMSTKAADEAKRGDTKFEGKRFVITDDSLGIAEKLKTQLESHGASVEVIGFHEKDSIPENLGKVDGLIHLWGLNPESNIHDVKRFFSVVRDTLTGGLSVLMVASGMGGCFGYYNANEEKKSADLGAGGGTAGMIKTIVREWPDLKAHWVDLDMGESIDNLATYLEMELLADNPLTEVGYHSGRRQIADVVKAALPENDDIDHLGLSKDSVLLITGGAQGITAKLAVVMAARFGCQLELVGRSPAPEEDETPEIAAAQDRMQLRKVILATEKGLTPAQIEKRCSRILSNRAMRNTFKEIEAVGGKVNYHSIDVRDIDAFSDLVSGLYEKYGKIDGVVHGAGVLEDKLLVHKTHESFERVFDTKVRGALVLSKLIRDDVKFVVFFSSVAGAFGNRGQIDYASANDALDKIAHNLQSKVNGRVLSVNWGPWAGRGMVSEELEREYARKGIGLIPLDEGVNALINELRFGTKEDTQVVLMCASVESMMA
ncbi:Phenolphthiocerol synthesis polyketide synthase type I Pks15/1 [Thalassocella blandensis]|nr:Phenolphthiocerol synthesis polyketide synthase type I Pks15/1 [Thalassocella blandensis]